MQKVLTVAQMRTADLYTINQLNIPSQTLMCRAGLAIADEVAAAAEKIHAMKILVVCGTGNNGGDGYVCAQELKTRGFNVAVYAIDGSFSADCAREKAVYSGKYSEKISADIIVDCLFGTGLCRTVSGEYAKVIEKINQSGAYVISADIPSGLNGDRGLAEGCSVKADITVAIAENKVGYFLNDGPDYCGRIIKKDIGITCPEDAYAQIFEDCDIKEFYPKRRRNTHKGTFGTAQLIVGSDRYIGAAVLSAEAALKSGCGYVKLNTNLQNRTTLAAKLPQIIFADDIDFSADCVAVGSGCGVSENLYQTIQKLLKEYSGTLIIDADGLNSLAKYGVKILKDKKCSVILTPHIKEFSRLSKLPVHDILSDPVTYARNFANEYKVTVLLKNAVSVLTDGERVFLLHRGNSALAKGGSGDMLLGLACGTAARKVDGFNAVAVASYTLGLAAEICAEERTEYCVTSKDLIKNIHVAVKSLTDR